MRWFLCVLCCLSQLLWAVPLTPPQEAVYTQLTTELRCLVCQNENLADSGAPMAADLRRYIRIHLAKGESGAMVRSALRQRYGDTIDFRPSFNGHTLVLWVGPGVVLLLVLWVAYRRGRYD